MCLGRGSLNQDIYQGRSDGNVRAQRQWRAHSHGCVHAIAAKRKSEKGHQHVRFADRKILHVEEIS